MAIIELDARFPTAIPLEAANLLTGEVSYTEEVPIKVRWAIADAGGHSVRDAEILVTTDGSNEEVQMRLDRGEKMYSVGLASAVLPAELPPGKSSTDTAANAEPEFNVSADDPLGIGVSKKNSESTDTGSDSADSIDSAESIDSSDSVDSIDSAGTWVENHGDGPVIEVIEVPSEATLPELEGAVQLMELARRRGEWESRQTHSSLLPYLLEESYEFIDAVNDGGDILGELSDLLLQVLFHAEIAPDFTIEDVAAAFIEKMRRRSPYLFQDSDDADGLVSADEQETAWNNGRGRPRSQPPTHLPALALAEEAIRRARDLGIKDSEIPIELLAPTPGLELEGGAEARTRAVARKFLESITVEETKPPTEPEFEGGFESDFEDQEPQYEEDFAAEAYTEVTEIDSAEAEDEGAEEQPEPSPWAAPEQGRG